jgi:hypothetical protein
MEVGLALAEYWAGYTIRFGWRIFMLVWVKEYAWQRFYSLNSIKKNIAWRFINSFIFV